MYTQLFWNAPAPTLRILTYHRFSHEKYDPVAVKPIDFERQMKWLKANVDLMDHATFDLVIAGKIKLEHDAVLITADDGHRSFFEHAYPVLKALKIPAIIFVCPGLIDEDQSNEFMRWDQLRVISENGISIASHGNRHISLAKIALEQAKQDILDAQHRLQECVTAHHQYLAFPFGTRRDFSPAVANLLLSLGYSVCFSSIHGRCDRITGFQNVFPRLKIESGESLRMFSGIVTGHLDAWKWVDHWAWRLQQREKL